MVMAETSNCEIRCAGSTIGNHKILRSLSHGKSFGWRKWSAYRPC